MAKDKFSVEVVRTELEINEELPLHEKGWTARNIGLVFMYLLIILAAFGQFGDGILSKKQVTEGTATIEFERFHRQEARMEIKASVQSDQDSLVISFQNPYLDKNKIESIVPGPKEVRILNGRVNYIFNSQGASSVVFYVVPQGIGNIQGSMLVNQNEFQLSHFIFP